MKSLHNEPAPERARTAAMERLWSLAILLGEGMQSGLAERGLTVARATLLWQLQLGGPSTQHSLSRALRVTPRNITGLVDALEAHGLVARKPHPSDRRATIVSLTAKGTDLARAMRHDQNTFAQELFEDLSAADLMNFGEVLDRVLSRMRVVLRLDEYDLATSTE